MIDFSVLMSVYGKDSPEFFRQALESISLAQTTKPKQIVVVEDGPVPSEVDKIIELVEDKAADIMFTVVRKDTNTGLAAALNTGLKSCKFEWIARMDSDDIATSDRFEKQIAYIESHPKISVLGGAISEFESDPSVLISTRVVPLEHDGIVRMMKTRTPMNHMSVMYKKQVVIDAGAYSEDFGKLEDYKLWVDLVTTGAIFANIGESIVNVRIGSGFLSRRSNVREIYDWDMLQTYLLHEGYINHNKAFKNRVYIRVFTYMPGWMKKIAYSTVLRK